MKNKKEPIYFSDRVTIDMGNCFDEAKIKELLKKKVVSFIVPKDCGIVVVAGNNGSGYRPYRCCLPHQIYLERIIEDFKNGNFKVISILPVRSEDAFDIAFNGKYEYDRWSEK